MLSGGPLRVAGHFRGVMRGDGFIVRRLPDSFRQGPDRAQSQLGGRSQSKVGLLSGLALVGPLTEAPARRETNS